MIWTRSQTYRNIRVSRCRNKSLIGAYKRNASSHPILTQIRTIERMQAVSIYPGNGRPCQTALPSHSNPLHRGRDGYERPHAGWKCSMRVVLIYRQRCFHLLPVLECARLLEVYDMEIQCLSGIQLQGEIYELNCVGTQLQPPFGSVLSFCTNNRLASEVPAEMQLILSFHPNRRQK